jgi:hypothetical protein
VLYIDEVREGKRFVGRVVMEEAPVGRLGATPVGDATVLDDWAAQLLADDLWNANFRARGAAGSAGQLDAVQAHLADIREIAKNFLDGTTQLAQPADSRERRTLIVLRDRLIDQRAASPGELLRFINAALDGER